MSEPAPLYQQIYTLIGLIPSGHVSSYGAIARKVGTTPRVVGFAMAALQPGNTVPWQRVINSKGEISPRCDGDGNLLQRILLEQEGIVFDHQGRVDLRRYGWTFADAVLPSDASPGSPQ